MKTILLIDDEINLLNVFSLMLKKKGYRVLKAIDGDEGIKIILSEDVDLVICDIYMPHKDGLAVIKQIRRILRYRNIPIIILSGGGTKENVFRGIELGVDAFLAKPCEQEELYQTVGKILEPNNNSAVNRYEGLKISKNGWERSNDTSILLVYKNASVTDNLYEFLSEHFYKIYIEENIEKVEYIINKKNIDLLIIEVCNRYDQSFRFLSDIYNRDKYIKIPIIVISEKKNELQTLFDCLDFQIDKIIMKPFEYKNLLKAILKVTDLQYPSEKLSLSINRIEKEMKENREKKIQIINTLRNEITKLKSENLKIINNVNKSRKEKAQIFCENNRKITKITEEISQINRIFLNRRQSLLEAKRIVKQNLNLLIKKFSN